MVTNSETCPHCENSINTWRRSISSGMAKFAWAMYEMGLKNPSRKYYHYSEVIEMSGVKMDYAHLQYFYVLAKHPIENGYWCLTDIGIEWLNGQRELPKYAYIRKNIILSVSVQTVAFNDVFKKGNKKGQRTARSLEVSGSKLKY